MYYASQGVKAVYSGSEWQYTAAGKFNPGILSQVCQTRVKWGYPR